MTDGERMYDAWRQAMKRHNDLDGNPHEPTWKRLKPKLKRVWEQAAANHADVYGTHLRRVTEGE